MRFTRATLDAVHGERVARHARYPICARHRRTLAKSSACVPRRTRPRGAHITPMKRAHARVDSAALDAPLTREKHEAKAYLLHASEQEACARGRRKSVHVTLRAKTQLHCKDAQAHARSCTRPSVRYCT